MKSVTIWRWLVSTALRAHQSRGERRGRMRLITTSWSGRRERPWHSLSSILYFWHRVTFPDALSLIASLSFSPLPLSPSFLFNVHCSVLLQAPLSLSSIVALFPSHLTLFVSCHSISLLYFFLPSSSPPTRINSEEKWHCAWCCFVIVSNEMINQDCDCFLPRSLS